MAITAQDVKKLRDLTNAGMMDCKKALTEAEGDFDRARDILRERGQLVAAKRADREAKDGVAIAKVSPDGKFTRSYGKTRYQSINLYTNYLFTLAEKHNFTVMAGYQEEDSNYSYMKNSITGLYSTSNPNVGMGTGDKVVVDTRNGWATRGFFGRINYDFDGRYLLELNGRYDGSSRFASDHRWGFFPSVSAGWALTEESFMPKSEILTYLKLRGSYGTLGNERIGDYPYQSIIGFSNSGMILLRTIFSIISGTAKINLGLMVVNASLIIFGTGVRVMKWIWQPLLTEFSTSKAKPYM